MSAPTVRVPAAARPDHRADAYNRALALADLTHHLDPALMVSLDIGARGRIDVLLHNDADLTCATELAIRLGLSGHVERPSAGTDLTTAVCVQHAWIGTHGGCPVVLTWFDRGAV